MCQDLEMLGPGTQDPRGPGFPSSGVFAARPGLKHGQAEGLIGELDIKNDIFGKKCTHSCVCR